MQIRTLFKQFIVVNLAVFSLLVIGCSKDKSFESPDNGIGVGAGSTSLFTLVPDGANCSDAGVQILSLKVRQ
ncbi:hypothetical protein [Paraflavitalea speifideaquila]|uniref:hypothetical protein n=1 Tax=Paraflavitalea speifideaquila TaxID=3076558 RepID=UPI0028E5B2D9|nr:hypothetical protein [Paraflavitalea speifideiaquila]